MVSQKKDKKNLVVVRSESRDLEVLATLNAQKICLEDKLAAIQKEYTDTINAIDKKYKKLLKDSKLESKVIGKEETKLLNLIKKELNKGFDMISNIDIFELAIRNKIQRKKVPELIETLEREGELYKPRHGYYTTTKG